MIALAFIACLATSDCRDFTLLYDPHEVSVIGCMRGAEVELAVWKQEHPVWTITRWTCGYQDPGSDA